MMARKRNVQKMDNEYVQRLEQKVHKRTILKKHLKKRLMLFGAVVLIVCTLLSVKYFDQRSTLASKSEEQMTIETQLQGAKVTQQQLNNQLALLNDDEYIAKLARDQYLLSEEGEIIFTIPKKEVKTKKQLSQD